MVPSCLSLSRPSSRPACLILWATVQGSQLLCLLPRAHGAQCQERERPALAQDSLPSFPLLRRKLSLLEPESRCPEVGALGLSGEGQVLSKHQAHWAASAPPQPLYCMVFLGCAGCSAEQASGVEGRGFPGSSDLAGGRDHQGLVPAPVTSFRSNFSPLTSLSASGKSNLRTGSRSPELPLDSPLLLAG